MSVHEKVMASMKEMSQLFAAKGIQLELPPNSNRALGTEYVDWEEGRSLSAKIPFDVRYTNPLKMYQGGLIGAAFDEVFGPLTYMVAAQPVVTLQMSTTFVRPFTIKDEYLIVKAELVAKTKSTLILRAEAKTKGGKLVATANNNSMILSESNLKTHS